MSGDWIPFAVALYIALWLVVAIVAAILKYGFGVNTT